MGGLTAVSMAAMSIGGGSNGGGGGGGGGGGNDIGGVTTTEGINGGNGVNFGGGGGGGGVDGLIFGGQGGWGANGITGGVNIGVVVTVTSDGEVGDGGKDDCSSVTNGGDVFVVDDDFRSFVDVAVDVFFRPTGR